MRRPSRRIFTEAPHQNQVSTHALIENANSVQWVFITAGNSKVVRTEEEEGDGGQLLGFI